MFERIREDIEQCVTRATRQPGMQLEILTCYPGLHAILFYRFEQCMLWRTSG